MTRPKNPRTPSAALAERILDAFPSGSYALSGLLRLMDIVETAEVPTAAVECRAQPRLLVNPEFAARHAATPERLLVLVMHELHHVLLGHTTLFPRITAVQNFVFDAVINGIVCRMFPDEEYTGFFTGLYDAARFPECLLRPPPGWPGACRTAPAIAALPEAWREQADELHRALYSDVGASYREVFQLLPKLLSTEAIAAVPLLGGHETPAQDPLPPLMFDAVRDIVEHWPQPPDPIRGRSLADIADTRRVVARPPAAARRILRQLIRRIADSGSRGALRDPRLAGVPTMTPLPGLARRSLVQRALGLEPLLHPGETRIRRIVPAAEKVHVYLDVSGSMDAVMAPLYGAVLDCAERVQAPVHLFSTRIADVSLAELRRGACHSTGGTSIDCVASHIAAQHVRRALIVTDGWTGAPRGQHRATLARTRLAVAFFGPRVNTRDLASVADCTAVIPLGELQ